MADVGSAPAKGAGGVDSLALLKRVYRFVRPDTGDIWAVAGFAIAVGILALAVPVAAQVLFNYISFGIAYQPVIVLGVALFVALAISATLRLMMQYVVELMQRRLFVRLIRDLGDKLPRTSIDAFGRVGGAEYVNRFFDFMTMQKVGATLLLDGIAAFLQTVIGLVILWFYSFYLFGFSLILLVAATFVLTILGRGAVRTAVAESTVKYQSVAALEEIVLQRSVYRYDGGPALARARTDAFAEQYVEARTHHFRLVLRQLIGAFAVQVVASSSILILGGYLVISQQLSLGQLVASELIVTVALASFLKIAMKMKDIFDLLAGVHKLSSLTDLPRERDSGDELPRGAGAVVIGSRVAEGGSEARGAAMALHDITFSYAGSRPLFSGLDLEVRSGERLTIVGGTGSGKRTLTELLTAARSPSAGRVELDGIDLRELSIESIREHVVLLEKPELVSGTLRDNVLLGRPGLTGDDCRDAIARVGLLEAVMALPDGLDTRVSRESAPLSQGQQHQLMIARALAGKARMLLMLGTLDEVDPRTRQSVAVALEGLPCTVVNLVRDITHVPDALKQRAVAVDSGSGSLLEIPVGPTEGGPGRGEALG